MRKRSKTKRRAGPKVWLAAITLIAALLLIGEENPQLRRTLEDMLQEVITGEPRGEQHTGSSRVIDGDTLDVAGSRVRLYGIDRTHKLTILIVEQNVPMVFRMTDRCVIIENGTVVAEGTRSDLEATDAMREYLAI